MCLHSTISKKLVTDSWDLIESNRVYMITHVFGQPCRGTASGRMQAPARKKKKNRLPKKKGAPSYVSQAVILVNLVNLVNLQSFKIQYITVIDISFPALGSPWKATMWGCRTRRKNRSLWGRLKGVKQVKGWWRMPCYKKCHILLWGVAVNRRVLSRYVSVLFVHASISTQLYACNAMQCNAMQCNVMSCNSCMHMETQNSVYSRSRLVTQAACT